MNFKLEAKRIRLLALFASILFLKPELVNAQSDATPVQTDSEQKTISNGTLDVCN